MMSAASSTRSKRSRRGGNDSPRPRASASYQPYFRRATSPDVIAAAAGDRGAARRFIETSYPHDRPWQRALRRLLPQSPTETREAFRSVLEQWEQAAPKLLDLTPKPVSAEAQRIRRSLRRSEEHTS